jgi:hypothetical protein
MFSTLSRKMGFSKAKSLLFDGPESHYFLHFQSLPEEAEGKFKKAYQITGFEKATEKDAVMFGEEGNQQNDVRLFMDKFIDVDLSMFGENWFEKYILLIGKKRDAIDLGEIEIQNEFSEHQLAPKIIYYDKKSTKGPIIIIEKCEHDLFDFILKTKNCDSRMLDKVIELYQFPETLNYIYLDVKPENMIVCRNSPDEDYDLQLIDFGIPYILDFSRADEKEKKKIRVLGHKIMLATFLINCLKFYDICKEFCDELSSFLNEIIKPSDWENISKRRTFHWVMSGYLKRMKNEKFVKKFKGHTKAFFTKASLYFEMDKGPGKLTKKSKSKKNSGSKQKKARSKNKSKKLRAKKAK